MPPIGGPKKKSSLSILLQNSHTIIRTIFLGVLLYGIYIEYKLGELIPGRMGHGGPYKFLTYLNHLLQTLYLFLVVISPPKVSAQTTITFHDRLFQVVMPLSFIVSAMFWVLHSQNMFGDLTNYPNDLNHIQHTFVAFVVLFELLLERKVGINNNFEGSNLLTQAAPLIVFFTIYLCWSYYLKTLNGVWAYSFLNAFSLHQFAVFSAGVIIVGVLFLLIGKALNKAIYPAPVGIVLSNKNKSQ